MLNMLKKRKGRVLVLDDDPAIQRLVAKILKNDGYAVEVVGKGNEAIESIAKTTFDVIILDLMMPHEGGMTVMRHLREQSPAMLQKVVLLTATPESVLRSIAPDIFAIVHKPFEPDHLLQTVRSVT
jgi:DNA-binding response OmpR family regulator